jgi:hypothetical protein
VRLVNRCATDPDRQTLLVTYASVLEARSRSHVAPRVKLELGARWSTIVHG